MKKLLLLFVTLFILGVSAQSQNYPPEVGTWLPSKYYNIKDYPRIKVTYNIDSQIGYMAYPYKVYISDDGNPYKWQIDENQYAETGIQTLETPLLFKENNNTDYIYITIVLRGMRDVTNLHYSNYYNIPSLGESNFGTGYPNNYYSVTLRATASHWYHNVNGKRAIDINKDY